MKPVSYSRSALKTLRKMPGEIAGRIMAKVDQYAADPAAQANNVTALQGA
jgi:mRNA interferase RelE/StbE